MRSPRPERMFGLVACPLRTGGVYFGGIASEVEPWRLEHARSTRSRQIVMPIVCLGSQRWDRRQAAWKAQGGGEWIKSWRVKTSLCTLDAKARSIKRSRHRRGRHIEEMLAPLNPLHSRCPVGIANEQHKQCGSQRRPWSGTRSRWGLKQVCCANIYMYICPLIFTPHVRCYTPFCPLITPWGVCVKCDTFWEPA